MRSLHRTGSGQTRSLSKEMSGVALGPGKIQSFAAAAPDISVDDR
jgi:hypothetical protein